MSREASGGFQRRSQGQFQMASALWCVGPRDVALKPERLAAPEPGRVRVRTHFSAISRGTERLVLEGQVPPDEFERMRAPMQVGDFPFPVKYGYAATGIVEAGPDAWRGRPVFCLHPHQDVFWTPVDDVVALPEALPLRRATLAANMETALNAVWDGGLGPGVRVAVVGCGIVGLLVCFLAARITGAQVTACDVQAERGQFAELFGAAFVQPEELADTHDVVFHTSASGDGLEAALAACGFEATLVELSWYGSQRVEIGLGGRFHSQRLRFVSSQVGHVAPSHRSRWSRKARLGKAIELLDDPVLDGLVVNDISFATLADTYVESVTSTAVKLPPIIRYPG